MEARPGGKRAEGGSDGASVIVTDATGIDWYSEL